MRLQSIAVALLMGALIVVSFAYTRHRDAYVELQLKHEMAEDKWAAERARLQSQVASMEIASYHHHQPTMNAQVGITR
jgi:hypothetical protein